MGSFYWFCWGLTGILAIDAILSFFLPSEEKSWKVAFAFLGAAFLFFLLIFFLLTFPGATICCTQKEKISVYAPVIISLFSSLALAVNYFPDSYKQKRPTKPIRRGSNSSIRKWG